MSKLQDKLKILIVIKYEQSNLFEYYHKHFIEHHTFFGIDTSGNKELFDGISKFFGFSALCK